VCVCVREHALVDNKLTSFSCLEFSNCVCVSLLVCVYVCVCVCVCVCVDHDPNHYVVQSLAAYPIRVSHKGIQRNGVNLPALAFPAYKGIQQDLLTRVFNKACYACQLIRVSNKACS